MHPVVPCQYCIALLDILLTYFFDIFYKLDGDLVNILGI